MSDLPDSHPSDDPMTSGPQHVQRRSAVSRSEHKLAALRLALVQAKRSFHEASVRERSIRERTVGRAVWALIEQGRLEPSVIALIRDEVRPFLSPGRAAAFIGTVFELPTMPVGSAQEPVKSATAVSLAEPDIPTATQLPTKPFRLPARPAPT
jgi:hypothetical protein